MLSAGTYKGYGLGLLIDILCGAFTGAGGANTISRANGIFLLLLKPDLFVGRGEYLDTVEGIVKFVQGSLPREGFDRILLPGDPEYAMMEERTRDGIPLYLATMVRLKKVADDLKVPFPYKLEAPSATTGLLQP